MWRGARTGILYKVVRPARARGLKRYGRRGEALADVAFEAVVILWRGPAPFHFAAVPPEHVGELRYARGWRATGWGVTPVAATVGGTDFRTSLFPKDGGYLLPLKAAVRAQAGIGPGDVVRVRLRVMRPGADRRAS